MRFRFVLGAIASVSLGLATRADAADPVRTTQLVYTRDDRGVCPDEEKMKEAVSARLGYDPFEAEGTQIVTASIIREAGGFRGKVDIRDRGSKIRGSRVLTTDESDCAELASTMALAISIAIDPMSVTRASTPPLPAPPSSTASTPAPVAAPTPASAPDQPTNAPRPTSPRVGLRMGMQTAIAFGAVPSASFAPSVFAGLAYRSVSLDLEGRAHLPGSVDAPEKGKVSASLLLAMLAPCVHVDVVVGCALVGVGRLAGRGQGVDDPAQDAAFYANVGARLAAEIRIAGPLFARVAGDVLLPLVSTTLRIREVEAWSTPSVTAALGGGLLMQLR